MRREKATAHAQCHRDLLHVRRVDTKARTVDCIMSTDDVDSYGESVAQNWRLERYSRNPVVLFAHDSRSLPIGRAENVRLERGALRCTIRFASVEANPLAEQCLTLFRDGMLNGVSVGFIPHTVRTEKRDGKDVTVLDDNELFELSVTPVPANANALAQRDASGDAYLEDAAREMAARDPALAAYAAGFDLLDAANELQRDEVDRRQRMTRAELQKEHDTAIAAGLDLAVAADKMARAAGQ